MRAQDRMLLLHMTAEQRVASFLLFVARKTKDRLRRGAEIDLPMSRGDIADYLGLTIETVCRTLAKLRTRGLIAVPNTHQIVLLIPSALMEIAGEVTSRVSWPPEPRLASAACRADISAGQSCSPPST